MTTATRPQPEHGADDRCYRNGCRRNECRDAYRNTRKRSAFRRARGIPGHIPGPRIAAHLRAVIASGKTGLQIAAESGVSDRTIRYILAGQPEVQRAKAAALLAVQPLPAPARIDPTGTRRRIQALAAIGWPAIRTADEAGMSRRYMFDIFRGAVPAIERHLADQVTAVYRAKCTTAGPSAFARNRAARNGWPGPLDWADIDDPAEQPDAAPVEDPELKRDELAAQRREEIWLLHTARLGDEEIARRVGLSASTVHNIRAEFRTGRKRDRRKQVAA